MLVPRKIQLPVPATTPKGKCSLPLSDVQYSQYYRVAVKDVEIVHFRFGLGGNLKIVGEKLLIVCVSTFIIIRQGIECHIVKLPENNLLQQD
jgi:hypothetical protein